VALAPQPLPQPAAATAAAAVPDAMAASAAAARSPGHAGLQVAGLALVVGALAALADYARVVPVFEADAGAAPLAQRIATGQRSVLFAHHAHYAAGTVTAAPAAEMASLQQAAHHLLDTRLMMAWARAYADSGDLERARFIAARLREFRNPASAEFFEPCTVAPAGAAAGTAAPAAPVATRREAVLADQPEPFQCSAPTGTLGWRDFRAP
jgi:hypothetical protein